MIVSFYAQFTAVEDSPRRMPRQSRSIEKAWAHVWMIENDVVKQDDGFIWSR